MTRLTRSQVAQRLGRSVATVRLLEQEGTLIPTVSMSRRRLFESDDVDDLLARCGKTGRFVSGQHSARSRRHQTAEGQAGPTSREAQALAAHAALRAGVAEALDAIIESRSIKDTKMLAVLEDLLALVGDDPV